MSVLYLYRCAACGHRGELHLEGDRADGAAATCAQCHAAVTLEWDAAVTLEIVPHAGVPTPTEIKHLRVINGRTQTELADRLGVLPRQVQRWEAGEAPMPIAAWQLLRRVWGFRGAMDLQRAPHPTRGWDTQRDAPRDTIERGDVVELQPKAGPRLLATVTYAAPRDDLYEALVTEFPGAGDVGEELDGYCLGERVQFRAANVLHLEQRAPRG
ncbi:helix-turn-helix domain-containing protein (plasmid) [Burkholderia sp. FERM BP-3421]|uniref:helix-turn-helix domain-containing protein n=1 Tax=Burkholderia sp. FERM BP-3421 TaxID=1494466 RepID=UPI0023615767|nr:helix-turn-helix domain-containing protein [Burkholderia sp. FERM BP-3421]WDD90308.1 helix-turn-helix domain-containing protein [Burkholderia sp. FERM BP-3421]